MNWITKIIKDLRNFAKDASHDPFEVAELKPIILNSFELYSEKLKNYSFEVEFHCDEDFYVSTRKVELQQAFSNLVVNSFDFGKGKEKSWIKVIISKVKTGHIQVLFSDSGGGISPSIQDKIQKDSSLTSAYTRKEDPSSGIPKLNSPLLLHAVPHICLTVPLVP